MEPLRQIGSQLSQCNRAVRTALLCGLKGILLCACALLITPASAATPETRITSEIFSRCAQLDETTVECDYRQINPRALDGMSARLGELELPTPELFAFPQPGDIAAVLFLIDTSDPNRRNAVRAGVRHIKQMLDASADHHVLGIATFDSNMQVVAELGSPVEQLKQALEGVQAAGRTTEMYRNTLAAIKVLADFNANRKMLVLLSDGLAEDRAYFHADVAAEARKHGITIDGMGYPRSVSLSVGLQTLRRLAEETGGRFVEGDTGFNLSAEYLANPFASLDDGGGMIVDIGTALDAGATGNVELALTWQREGSATRLSIPLKLPDPLPPPTPEAKAPAPQIVYVQTPPADLPANATVVQAQALRQRADIAPENNVAAATTAADGTTLSGDEATAEGPTTETGAVVVRDDGAKTTSGNQSTAAEQADSAAASTVGDGGGSADAAPAPNLADSGTTGSDNIGAGTSSTNPGASASANGGGASETTAAGGTYAGSKISPPKPAFTPNPLSHIGALRAGTFSLALPALVQQWFWGIVAAVILLILLVVLLVVRSVRKRRSEAHTVSAAALAALAMDDEDDERQTYAFLENTTDGQRYPITSAAFRIGRHADNELPLHDASISRHHAQIHRKRDGTFTISDLESMNGVFVNDKRIPTNGSPLREGDAVELGDVKMRFTMLSADPLAGEETVVVRTVAPGKFGTAA